MARPPPFPTTGAAPQRAKAHPPLFLLFGRGLRMIEPIRCFVPTIVNHNTNVPWDVLRHFPQLQEVPGDALNGERRPL